MKEIEILTLTVSVLSILVMVLIGWQIFNVLTFEKRISRIKKKMMKYTEDMTNESSLMVMSTSFVQSAFNLSVMGDHDGALKADTQALRYLLGLKLIYKNNPNEREDTAGRVVNNIKGIIERPGAVFSQKVVDESIESLRFFDSRSAHRAISIIRDASIKE